MTERKPAAHNVAPGKKKNQKKPETSPRRGRTAKHYIYLFFTLFFFFPLSFSFSFPLALFLGRFFVLVSAFLVLAFSFFTLVFSPFVLAFFPSAFFFFSLCFRSCSFCFCLCSFCFRSCLFCFRFCFLRFCLFSLCSRLYFLLFYGSIIESFFLFPSFSRYYWSVGWFYLFLYLHIFVKKRYILLYSVVKLLKYTISSIKKRKG